MFIGFEDAAKESGRRGRALRVVRLVVPFLSGRWLSDPSTVSEDERVPGPDDPIMPAGRTLAAGTVMRRRRLRHVLTTWGGGLLLLGISGYAIGDYALSGGEDYPFSIDGTALAVGFALALLIGLALPAARKLRPARRSDHLGLAPDAASCGVDGRSRLSSRCPKSPAERTASRSGSSVGASGPEVSRCAASGSSAMSASGRAGSPSCSRRDPPNSLSSLCPGEASRRGRTRMAPSTGCSARGFAVADTALTHRSGYCRPDRLHWGATPSVLRRCRRLSRQATARLSPIRRAPLATGSSRARSDSAVAPSVDGMDRHDRIRGLVGDQTPAVERLAHGADHPAVIPRGA